MDECAFDVYEYINFDYLDIDFVNKHRIAIQKGQSLITGRACQTLKIGDHLLSETHAQITILNIFSYCHQMNIISAGMSCAIVIDLTSEDLSGQKLQLVKGFTAVSTNPAESLD